MRPTGDQPKAIAKLVSGLESRKAHQVLLGITGSGKTYTLANVIEKVNRPALVISPNKILAAQLYQEFREFFPDNAIHYFVSYYDYYQPEAYIPHTDTYIEKDAKINDVLDQLRHAATADALSRRDTIVVASVSCIYGLGDPATYKDIGLALYEGAKIRREEVLKHLVALQYSRNDYDPRQGEFRTRENSIEIWLPHGQEKINIVLEGRMVQEISRQSLQLRVPDPRAPRYRLKEIRIFPAKHFVTPREKLEIAARNIQSELYERLKELKKEGRILEAQRLAERTRYDLELLREIGYCPGIENYSRHLSFRKPGEPPYTLLDYFPKDFLVVVDESHLTLPQIRAMAEGDRARKTTLVKFGFRLPSAVDNRPLTFEEFEKKIGQIIYVSATPGLFERKKTGASGIAEQLIRPTGILDPEVVVKPTKNQIAVLMKEIARRIKQKERALVLTLTKRLAEDLAEYLAKRNIRVHWLHSEIKTLARPELLRDLRLGKVDVIVGVNLLREGLDLPEVALVVILDADKEGFLRNETTLIQAMGRAARNVHGKVILFADTITRSMARAIAETRRRRRIQAAYNTRRNIMPRSITKPILVPLLGEAKRIEDAVETFGKQDEKKFVTMASREQSIMIDSLEKEMWEASKDWDFERAARIRNHIQKLKKHIA